MQEGRDTVNDVCAAIGDGFRKIDEFSYAILPRDVAHAVADLNKAVLTQFRNFIDWRIRWNDERVAGGDRMREEWREKCREQSGTEATTEI